MQDVEQMAPSISASSSGDVDLKEVARVILARRKLVAITTGTGSLLAAAVSFSQPNIYPAAATIMPIDSSNDRLSAALSSMGSLGGLAAQAGVGLKGNVSDKFVAILKSRTLAENVITKHNLLPSLFPERWDTIHHEWKVTVSPISWLHGTSTAKAPTIQEAARRLSAIAVTRGDAKTGLIEIRTEHPIAQVAADIANDYVVELHAFLQGNSLTSEQQNKDFLEKQLQKVSGELTASEGVLKSFQEDHKLVSLDAQAQASVQAYAALKSQLITKEMELNLQSKSTSAEDVLLVGLRQEISQLKDKLAALENGSSGGMVSFKDAPSLGMRFAQLSRDILVRQKVFELITQQYELSKINEAKEAFSFQVIDRAVPAENKSKPRRLLMVSVASILSFLAGCCLAFTVDILRKIR